MQTIVILTTSEGHQSIAEALRQTLAKQYTVHVVFHQIDEFKFHILLYKIFPASFFLPYLFSNTNLFVRLARSLMYVKYAPILLPLVEKAKPDLLISTYVLFDDIGVQYGKLHNIPVLNVIANPRSIHRSEAHKESLKNLVFDQKAKTTLIRYGIQPDHIEVIGWPVRSQFAPSKDVPLLRQQLHLLPNLPTLLLTGGSEGTDAILSILPFLFRIPTPMQLVIIVGRNVRLQKMLEYSAKRLISNKTQIRLHILGFTEHIDQYIAASDLVLGKAGPNTIFETVACGVPFFAHTHMAGQEDGNLNLIRDYQLGWVEENPFKAGAKLTKLLKTPQLLHQFDSSIEVMRKNNNQCTHKILNIVQDSL